MVHGGGLANVGDSVDDLGCGAVNGDVHVKDLGRGAVKDLAAVNVCGIVIVKGYGDGVVIAVVTGLVDVDVKDFVDVDDDVTGFVQVLVY